MRPIAIATILVKLLLSQSCWLCCDHRRTVQLTAVTTIICWKTAIGLMRSEGGSDGGTSVVPSMTRPRTHGLVHLWSPRHRVWIGSPTTTYDRSRWMLQPRKPRLRSAINGCTILIRRSSF